MVLAPLQGCNQELISGFYNMACPRDGPPNKCWVPLSQAHFLHKKPKTWEEHRQDRLPGHEHSMRMALGLLSRAPD